MPKDLWIEVEELEKKRILKVLEETNGNIVQASEKLNVSIPTIYRKMAKYGIKIKRKIEIVVDDKK